MSVCSFCGLVVWLSDVDVHPCCRFAAAQGWTACPGCEAFKARDGRTRRTAA
jgi:hypothetical protein